MKIPQFIYSIIANNTPMTTEEVNRLRGDAENYMSELPKVPQTIDPKEISGWQSWVSFLNENWMFRTVLALLYPFVNRFWKEYVYTSDSDDDDESIESILKQIKTR